MKQILFSIGIAIAVIFFGTILIFEVETQYDNSQIKTYTDALWWTVSTITTVGYGDIVPVSETGRLVSIVFMFTGIILLGIIITWRNSQYTLRVHKQDFEIIRKLIQDEIKDLSQKYDSNNAKIDKILEQLEKLKSKFP